MLIKASAGGGGMRLVERPAIDEALALSVPARGDQLFGDDDHVLVERYVTRPRHIEIQILPTPKGGASTFGATARCSAATRKVLEEAAGIKGAGAARADGPGGRGSRAVPVTSAPAPLNSSPGDRTALLLHEMNTHAGQHPGD